MSKGQVWWNKKTLSRCIMGGLGVWNSTHTSPRLINYNICKIGFTDFDCLFFYKQQTTVSDLIVILNSKYYESVFFLAPFKEL